MNTGSLMATCRLAIFIQGGRTTSSLCKEKNSPDDCSLSVAYEPVFQRDLVFELSMSKGAVAIPQYIQDSVVVLDVVGSNPTSRPTVQNSR
jgi:hypothetical protein